MKYVFEKVYGKQDTYSVWLLLNEAGDVSKYSCTCIFGSFYRYAKFWKDKKTLCKHIKEVLKKHNLKLEELK